MPMLKPPGDFLSSGGMKEVILKHFLEYLLIFNENFK